MQFNQTSSPRGGIIQNIERKSCLGLGTISDNAAPDYYLDLFLALINKAGDTVRMWIDEVNDEWTSRDSNNTGDDPESKSFVDDTQAFDLDSNDTTIRKVEIHDATKIEPEGWITLDYYFEADRIDDLYGQDSGMPSKYFLKDRQIIFDVPVDITKADKYRLTKDEEAHEFVIGDTTAEPGIKPKICHWLYVYLPIIEFTKDNDIKKDALFQVYGSGDNDTNSLKHKLQEYHRTKNRDMKYQLSRGDTSKYA